jgi:hypothetical protein
MLTIKLNAKYHNSNEGKKRKYVIIRFIYRALDLISGFWQIHNILTAILAKF